jgi:hypothetical protein
MSAAFWRSISAALARSSRPLDSASSAFSVQLGAALEADHGAAHFLGVGDRAGGGGADLDQRFLHLEDDHADHPRRILRPVEQLGEIGGHDVPRAGKDAHSIRTSRKWGPVDAPTMHDRANFER